MSNRDSSSPQEELNKKLRKREKKLRERLLEAQEEQARAQERLQRAEARLQKRLARVQRLEAHLTTIKQHQTEPVGASFSAPVEPQFSAYPTPEQPQPTTETTPTPVGASFSAPSTPTTSNTLQESQEPPEPQTSAALITALATAGMIAPIAEAEALAPSVGAQFIAPSAPDETAPSQTRAQSTAPSAPQPTAQQEPVIQAEPIPVPTTEEPVASVPTATAQTSSEPDLQMASISEQAQDETATLEDTSTPFQTEAALLQTTSTHTAQEPSALATALPEWAQQEPAPPVGAQSIAPPAPEHDTNIEDAEQVEQLSEPATQAKAHTVSTPDDEPQAAVPSSPIGMSEAAAFAPVDMDDEAGYGPSLDELLHSNEQDYEPKAPSVLETATAIPTSSAPSFPLPTAHAVTLEQAEDNASEARAVVEATEQNTRLAAGRALALTEEAHRNIPETAASTRQSDDSAGNNLLSPELALSAKAIDIASIEEEEEEVEMVTSTMVANAAAAAAAEAEAAAEASSARTREARRLAQEADLMLEQVRMAIERGVLHSEDAEAALHFTEREATRAHTVLIDAEAAEEQAMRTAMNAEAEAEVAEGMSLAVSQHNTDEHMQSEHDEEVPVNGILLDELPDDDETVEIPIIHPKENL